MLKYKKSFFRLSITTILFLIMFVSLYVFRNHMIYNSLTASLKQKEIKYGNKVNLKSLLKDVNGSYKVVTDVDTKKLGNQEVLVDTYTVRPGDTLYSISRKFNISIDELRRLNNLTSNILSIGQILTI